MRVKNPFEAEAIRFQENSFASLSLRSNFVELLSSLRAVSFRKEHKPASNFVEYFSSLAW
jgi:hypothetical protein